MSIEKKEGFLSISSLDFFGCYVTSPDGRFDLGFNSGGQFVLLEGNNLVLKGKVDAQIEGCVSNSGTFLLAAVISLETLRSELIAFDVHGKKIFTFEFKALLLSLAIAPTGRFAVSQAGMSDSDDALVLAFFDIASATELWRTPWYPRPDSYEFDEGHSELTLVYKNAGKFRFAFNGDFLDENRWLVNRLRLLGGKELISAVQGLIAGGLNSAHAEDVVTALLDVDSRAQDTEWPKESAAVKRALGEVYEAIGRISDAMSSYELALRLDPKVGARKRYEALKKSIGATSP